MPARRALQVCPTPGCPNLTKAGRCPTCQAAATHARGSARAKGYDGRWERTRAAYLREHPYCECDDCTTLPELLRPRATEVNHRDGLGPHGPRGHDWANLQAMTKAHHSRHTAREQPGGWNDRDR
ncbi:HNH endonuclease signature motif containing protein [Streptomyces sp. B1866]|uniref:HNH endonuclease signature motif containing protein n=1 Tax=Streptomyces sp. B1866 TaxID=3075431 RepID=UPI0028907C0C|nr:HNH endonuclease signature motif containing protein [Streptomyces sp. B1866]MDT3395447.1 HNH endonuclease signature motif containing protein [Streptomyces sp. B1866]